MSESALHVYSNGTDWYVGASLDDALAAQREFAAYAEADQWPEEWGQESDAEPLTIVVDDNGQPAAPDDDSVRRVTKTCAEWAAERGRGFLCSTEY